MTRQDAPLWQIAETILTRKQYEAFTLHHRYELTVSDIAAHLEITRQAAGERIRKAEQRIATHLARKAAA